MATKKPSLVSPKQPFDALAKIAVIGDSSVGKTNILLRYVNSDYQLTHITTIGIDFKVKTITLDNFKLKMQIWDTAGQQRFRNLSGTIYQGAQAIILVYSVANRKSYTNVEKWIQDISNKTKGSILLAIVGNKCDLKDERQVSTEQGILMANKVNAKIYMETSAKEGTGIQQLFQKVGRAVIEKAKQQTAKNSRPSAQNMVKATRSKTVTTGTKEDNQPVNPVMGKDNKLKLKADSGQNKKKGCC